MATVFKRLVIGRVYHAVAKRLAWLDGIMPAMAIVGILYATATTTASGRDNLLKVGALLFIASVLHSTAGYFFGCYLSRAAGLDKNSARSIKSAGPRAESPRLKPEAAISFLASYLAHFG